MLVGAFNVCNVCWCVCLMFVMCVGVFVMCVGVYLLQRDNTIISVARRTMRCCHMCRNSSTMRGVVTRVWCFVCTPLWVYWCVCNVCVCMFVHVCVCVCMCVFVCMCV